MLTRILEAKRAEVARRKEEVPVGELLNRGRGPVPASFTEALEKPGIRVIAEIKYRSPSHGPFLCQLPVEEIAGSYIENGAAAVSVLTDAEFFGGSLEDLQRVYRYLIRSSRESQDRGESVGSGLRPLLCKDFMVDRYQVCEARTAGASAFLLIVAALELSLLCDLYSYGEELGLEALVEVHDEWELEIAVESGARIIGVNNRNLKSFEVDIGTSFDLARRLEGEVNYTLVAESGISERSQILELQEAGFKAFLIGTTFMDSDDPGKALKELMRS
jgi:indole-3-glycerol phosphate synthase